MGRPKASTKVSYDDFKAGWLAAEACDAHEWGPAPPNNHQDAWLKYNGKPIPDKCPSCWSVNGGTSRETAGNIVLRHGKHGDFLGCSKFPQCRWTQTIPLEEEWDSYDDWQSSDIWRW